MSISLGLLPLFASVTPISQWQIILHNVISKLPETHVTFRIETKLYLQYSPRKKKICAYWLLSSKGIYIHIWKQICTYVYVHDKQPMFKYTLVNSVFSIYSTGNFYYQEIIRNELLWKSKSPYVRSKVSREIETCQRCQLYTPFVGTIQLQKG